MQVDRLKGLQEATVDGLWRDITAVSNREAKCPQTWQIQMVLARHDVNDKNIIKIQKTHRTLTPMSYKLQVALAH